ncbi:MAG TPA: hypothetical protein VD967_01310 [Candidatus Paceibacterota bacterium]|nr:hypothetical protein [Candidatus Paceibacterota bacterium]
MRKLISIPGASYFAPPTLTLREKLVETFLRFAIDAPAILLVFVFALAPSIGLAQTVTANAAATPTGSASFTVNGSKIATIAPGQNAQYAADFAGIPGGIVIPEYRLKRGSAASCGTVDGVFRPWESIPQPDSEGRFKYTRTDTAKSGQVDCVYELRISSQVNGASDAYDTVEVNVVSEAPAPTAAATTDAAPFGCYMGTKSDESVNVVFVQMLRTGERNIQNGIVASLACLFGDKAVKTKIGSFYSIPKTAFIAKKMKDAFGAADLTTAGLVAQLRSGAKEIFNENNWKLTAQINTGTDGTQAAYFLATFTPPSGSSQVAQHIQVQTGAVAATATDAHVASVTADKSQQYREKGMTFPLDPDVERVPTAKPPLPAGAIKVAATAATTAH